MLWDLGFMFETGTDSFIKEYYLHFNCFLLFSVLEDKYSHSYRILTFPFESHEKLGD